MSKILALILVISLWFNFSAPANAAVETVAGLKTCADTPAFQEKAKTFRNTTADPQSGQKRAERYAEAICGPEGYPHLIVDGRWSHMGDFFIPSILFLYIAGWIGWVARSYLQYAKEDKNPEEKEIIIDVPVAIQKMLGGFIWPLAAIKEQLANELSANDDEIPVSPR